MKSRFWSVILAASVSLAAASTALADINDPSQDDAPPFMFDETDPFSLDDDRGAPERKLETRTRQLFDTPDNPAEYPEFARKIYLRAVDLHLAGNIHESIEYYKRAIMLDPDSAAYHADLGEAYRGIGLTREAIIEFETAVTLNPNLANALTTLGVIYDRENLPHKAIEYHRQALRLEPDNYVALNNIGHAYDSLGLVRAAVINYRKAIDINPEFTAAYVNLADTYLRVGQVADAVDILKTAISIVGTENISTGMYHNLLAEAYALQARYAESFETLKVAIAIEPSNQDAQRNFFYVFDNLAKEALKTGNAESATAYLSQAERTVGSGNPRMALFYNSIGTAYMQRKMCAEAFEAFKKASALIPSEPDFIRNMEDARGCAGG
jgi:superkiller protein 3